MAILIRNGHVVTATDDWHGDIFVEGERISMLGADLRAYDARADTVIDAKGKLVIPGGVDAHTHLDLPAGGTVSADDFDTGTIAAAHGGTTTIVDFATQEKGQSTLQALDTWHDKARDKALIDYAFHMIVTDMPVSRLPELERLAEAGVTSTKLFMAYPGVLYVDDGVLYRTFRRAGELGMRVCMHAENGIVIDELIREAVEDGKLGPEQHARTRPTRMEAEGVHRAIAIAEVAEAPLYIVHLSSTEALDEVKRARARGIDVLAETCPQYLLLDDSLYDRPDFEGAKWVMTPPLRPRHHHDALWQGLQLGHLHNVATDHCPFCFVDQKALGRDDFRDIPNGAPGIEHRVSLLYHHGVRSGRLSLNQWVALVSTAAAKTFGLFPKKGTIAVGTDADLVIFDPEATRTIQAATHHMNVDYNAYEGMEITGWTDTVISRGRLIIDGGEKVASGGGSYVARARVGELLR